MIKNFRDAETRRFWEAGRNRRLPANISRVAMRKMQMLDFAVKLDDLKSPPGNRLEALKGSRRGQYSIRINDQFRICFEWRGSDAYEVEITDYH